MIAMSEQEFQQLILSNLSGENPTLASDTGLEAARIVAETAAVEGANWALCGGLAMFLYGSDRLTKDVDLISDKRLSLANVGQLRQGGERYVIKIGKYKVDIDWIVRADEAAKYYQTALREAVAVGDYQIVTAEWLLIMKLIADRDKDQLDGVYLLGKKGLVERPKVKENVVRVGGDESWAAIMGRFRRWCDLADGKQNEPDRYNQNFIDS